jgi:hypothetical protein
MAGLNWWQPAAGPLVLVKQTYLMRAALILPGVVLKRR